MKKIIGLLLLALSTPAFSQTASEIYLFDLTSSKKGVSISNPVNITNHKGYDNQPFIHPKQPLVYYTSFNDDGRADIKSYNYQTKETKSITQTQEREYSPTVTPDQKFLSCIIQRDNEAQDLGKYPIDGGEPIVLINNLIVGYHAWMDEERLIMFVLGTPHTLHYYNLSSKEDKILAENIGRSLHKIPNENAMSFILKVSDAEWFIKRLETKSTDKESFPASVITKTLPGHEDITWTSDGKIITSDGEKLFFYTPGKSKEWEAIKINSGSNILKGVTRLAASADGKKLAIVVAEN